MLAVCDARSGKLRKMIDIPLPTSIHAVSDRLVYVLSAGTTVLALDPPAGKTSPVVTGLENAVGLAVDAEGRIYVGTGEPNHQVKVFTADGQPVRTIGRKGGRPLLGPWQADGLYAISGLTIDAQQPPLGDRSTTSIPSGSACGTPRRASRLRSSSARRTTAPAAARSTPATRTCWSASAANGGSIRKRRRTAARAFSTAPPTATRSSARRPTGGCTWRSTSKSSTIAAASASSNALGEGNYRLRAEIRPDFTAKTTTIWSDVNGDGKPDAGETVTVPMYLVTYGSNCWSMNLNPHDFTVFPVASTCSTEPTADRLSAVAGRLHGLRRPAVGRGRHEGAAVCQRQGRRRDPAFARRPAAADLRRDELATAVMRRPPAGCCGAIPIRSSRSTARTTRRRPSRGSRAGPTASSARSPVRNTGTVWAINANLGEWYLLTEKGYFLARIFEGDPMQWQWPARAEVGADMTHCPPGSGGEDFGGSLTPSRRRQGLSPGRQDGRLERGTGQPRPGPRDRLRLGDPARPQEQVAGPGRVREAEPAGRGHPRLRGRRA